jgi:hypothetical protein
MNPVRKAQAKRKHRQARSWVIAASILILISTLLAAVYLWNPKNPANNHQGGSSISASPVIDSPTQAPSAFEVFTNHYLEIMHNLNSSETKTAIAPSLNLSYNQTDLFIWEQSKLKFIQDTTGWFDDPIQILNSGKGICEQFSVVYVSACLALGYQSRLVVAVDASSWNFIHVWAEDYFHGTWVHVDPSDSVWNNPSRYQNWNWGQAIGLGVKIYAFEDGTFQDVTSIYGILPP